MPQPSSVRGRTGTSAAGSSRGSRTGLLGRATIVAHAQIEREARGRRRDLLTELRRVRASGGATGERSSYGPLANLLNAVGATLRPKVFCVAELADQGAGHPDFGLFTTRQVQRGRPRHGQAPERGVVEVKTPPDDTRATAVREQVSRYWGRYRLVLVTNLREFELVGPDTAAGETVLESFRLAGSNDEFERLLETPQSLARAAGAGPGEYLRRALSHRSTIAEPSRPSRAASAIRATCGLVPAAVFFAVRPVAVPRCSVCLVRQFCWTGPVSSC